MISLQAKIRNKFGRQTKALRKRDLLPAVLYGAGIKNISLKVPEKQLAEAYAEAGESSLITLEVNGKQYQVLIHQVARDPLTGGFLHVDFYHPSTRKEVEAEVPLVFEGMSLAQKELRGVLVREIQAVEVKGLAQNLPREIKVDIEVLRSFEDRIYVKDLKVPENVKILKEPDEIVAHVTPPTEEKEEEKPVEEGKPAEAEASGEREEQAKEQEGGKKEEAQK